MQRYHVTNCNSAVNNNAISVGSTRDLSASRGDSLAPNYSVNSRRSSSLVAYKLKCDKEPLNSRLGPPDFHPQTTNCLEETLTKEYLIQGYKETVEGLEEAREITLSQVQCFSKPVVVRCREGIRKCLRAINESRAQKRKAGQVYGVPLSGVLLVRPGVFPEQRTCNDDFKKKWIEGLSQPHKRLRTLADHVPHGYRRKSLFEILIKNNVPLLRATWYIKVNYLNQVRPSQPNVPPGTPDKVQISRKELWTKDFVEYLQTLIDEFISKGNSHYKSSQILYGGSMNLSPEIEDPSLHFKWWYVVRLLHWHYAEGLLLPSLVVDWVLNQLQEKDVLEILQLLLPIIYGFLEDIILSQTYVRALASMAIRFFCDSSPGGADLVDNSRKAYTSATLIEMLRYLLSSVPETFVGIDCFPLPPAVTIYAVNEGNLMSKSSEKAQYQSRGLESQYQSLSLSQIVFSIQNQANNLSKSACSGNSGKSLVKAVQALDKALVDGDLSAAFDSLFDDFFDDYWVDEIGSSLKSSLRCIGDVSLQFISSVFLLFEWATCDFRDFRTAVPDDLKLSGGKDFSQIHIVCRLLKQKSKQLKESQNHKLSDLFESPGPVHDILVCWIDQHEISTQSGFRHVQFLVLELTRSGLFYPQTYARQLLSSGVLDLSGNFSDSERGKRHYQILKLLPSSFVHTILQEAKVSENSELSEIVSFYSNERRLLLNNLVFKSEELKRNRMRSGLSELKNSISFIMRFPNNSNFDSGIGLPKPEGFLGCEDCRKSKRQKISEEKSVFINSPGSDDEDTWWVRKGPKLVDSPKLEQPQKLTKQVVKGRQKNVRKTQSLAQLATTRMDTNQVASTSHICDNKLSCPHHKTGMNSESFKGLEASRIVHEDVASIGKALKRLRLADKKTIVLWLTSFVQQLVEDLMKTCSKNNQFGRSSFASDDRNSSVWKLGENELSAMLYLIDSCDDSLSGVKFLLWLLPKVSSNSNAPSHSGRTIILPKNPENHPCEIGEAFLISALRRYENIVVAADLIPDVLAAAMNRATTLLANTGRVSGSSFLYARHLLRKFGSLPSVSTWEKTFKTSCDKRLIPEMLKDLESGYPLGVPVGVEDVDEFLRQKMNVNRLSRAGMSMRDIVQRNIDDISQYYFGKDRKTLNIGQPKSPVLEKYDDNCRVAQQIVSALMECMLQTGGAAQEGDPSLVTSAVSAIVHNIGITMAKLPDFTVGGDPTSPSSSSKPLTIARRLLQIHINCLCLLKETLGERQSRVFEIALANEASSALAVVFAPGKGSRNQFQFSNESLDSTKGTKTAASISALVVGAIVHGVSTLERMVTVFRLKDGLDVTQYMRSVKSHANGNVRSTPIDVYVHWFRLLIGNFRSVCDGLVVELIGEPHIAAISRMQRFLPINLVFPPAYSIFAFILWRQLIFHHSAREDTQILFNSMSLTLNEAVKHLPFRDVCLRDSQAFYDLVASDTSDADFAALIDSNGLDRNVKFMAFVPLRGRLFLNAIIDCKMPNSLVSEDWNRISLHGFKIPQPENGSKILENIVDVLDALQPAKFHWQWIELRLLLNEQSVVEKLENLDMNFSDAIRSASSVSENESNIIEIILTRLLVRPDATNLFAELIYLLGRSLEDSMLKQVKWFLGGSDVLYGRKSIRQRLINIAESKGISISFRFRKSWGWCNSSHKIGKIKKSDSILEEGEVVADESDKKSVKDFNQITERALIDLILPCIDQSCEDSRTTFASELIKQLNNIEQQLSSSFCGSNKVSGATIRKSLKGGSPGLSKQRSSGSLEPSNLSPSVLRSSVALRLQLLLRLFPVIWADGEPSGRNLRHMLAPVVLRLLGNRVVYDNSDSSSSRSSSYGEDSLFDRLLFIFHALLSNSLPTWLKPNQQKSFVNCSWSGCDRDVLESLQMDLDRMILPSSVRLLIQAAMPILPLRFHPLSDSALAPPYFGFPGNYSARITPSSANQSRGSATNCKPTDMEIDPWTLLEDGTTLAPSSTSTAPGDHGNLRACTWLHGAVRVRRTDLTYIGAVDDDS